MFLNLILEFYDYIKALLGIKSKKKLDPVINITQVEEEFLLNNNNNNNYDAYNEYNELELVNNNPYSRQAYITKQNKKDNVSKSHNELVKIYYCGYCSRYIPMIIHMYNDKAYCSSHCRNRQLDNDYKNPHIRSISSSF